MPASGRDDPFCRLVADRVARNLSRLRRRAAWTQEEAAFRCGMVQQVYQRLETGHSNLTLRTIGRLADGFGVDVSLLFRR